MTKPLLVLGARQVGKTYIIDAFCKAEFRRYQQINLFEEPLLRQIYQSDLSSVRKFEQLQMLAGIKLDDSETVLFIDEVQEPEEFIADLKYLRENHPKTNIICAGSLLGVKLKRTKKVISCWQGYNKKHVPAKLPRVPYGYRQAGLYPSYQTMLSREFEDASLTA
jgi:predicted AAA+ superfamily ATPase